jgi:hypothetical protein
VWNRGELLPPRIPLVKFISLPLQGIEEVFKDPRELEVESTFMMRMQGG